MVGTDFPRNVASGSGSETAYSVEARMNYSQPMQIAGRIFDNRWVAVQFDKSAVGVPSAPFYARHTLEHGLLGYSAAQALRWWLHAQADNEIKGTCLETRIVKHKISYTHTIEAEAAHGYIGGDDRSNHTDVTEK